MNKTKQITQGAMLIAIIGALIELDKLTSFMFTYVVVLMVPVAVIMYASMHGLKNAIAFCIALIVVAFIVGVGAPSFTYFIYVPGGCIVGMGYSYVLNKTSDRGKLNITAMSLFLLVEVIAYFVVLPIMGINLSVYVNEVKTIMDEAIASASSIYDETTSQLLISTLKQILTDNLLTTMCVISIIIIALIEGLIVNILSTILLKRFHIRNDLHRGNLLDYRLNKVLAYICFGCMFIPLLKIQSDNESIKTILILLPTISSMILIFYGYIFAVIYLKINGKNKLIPLLVIGIVLLYSIAITLLSVLGFMYSAGTFDNYLENKGLIIKK